MPEEDIAGGIWDLVNLLAYLQEKKLAHQDLQPKNILVVKEGDRYKLKLNNFKLRPT